MRASSLIVDLASRDVRLSVAGNELRVDVPAGAMTAKLRQTLLEHKGELIEVLRLRSQFNYDESVRMAGCPDRAWQLAAQAKAIFGAEVVEVVDDGGAGDA